MSETKHAPGPWTIVEDTLGHPSFRVHNDTGDMMARAFLKANARLIAAAPELAQLAQDVLAELEAASCRAQSPEHCIACGLVAKARAALEKAGLR